MPRKTAIISLFLLGAVGLLAGGCVGNGPPYVTDARLDEGLVVILPGIEGPGVNNARIRQGLMDGELPYAMEIYNWIGWRMGASYAFDEVASRRRAAEVAARIASYQRGHPGRPVFLIGHSGGGAIAVFAAEAVDGQVRRARARRPNAPSGPDIEAIQPLTGLVTLAPALSPTYDLTVALSGCGGRFVNCYTSTDVMLRTATTVGRNFDGVPGPTAGQDGFRLPPGAPGLRERAFDYLRQIAWESSMARHGNLGGHLGWTSPPWVAHALAPILRQWAEKAAAEQGRSTASPVNGPPVPAR